MHIWAVYVRRVYKLTVRLKNQSIETLTALDFGWAFVPPTETETGCPTSFQTRKRETISVHAGDTTVLNIDGLRVQITLYK
jgi:hypothetical protein